MPDSGVIKGINYLDSHLLGVIAEMCVCESEQVNLGLLKRTKCIDAIDRKGGGGKTIALKTNPL